MKHMWLQPVGPRDIKRTNIMPAFPPLPPSPPKWTLNPYAPAWQPAVPPSRRPLLSAPQRWTRRRHVHPQGLPAASSAVCGVETRVCVLDVQARWMRRLQAHPRSPPAAGFRSVRGRIRTVWTRVCSRFGHVCVGGLDTCV